MTIYILTFKCDFNLQPTNLRYFCTKNSKNKKNDFFFFFFFGGGGGEGGMRFERGKWGGVGR